MFQHILVPLEGSTCAEQVLPLAAQTARNTGGTLTLLRVVARPEVYGFSPWILPHSEFDIDIGIEKARTYLSRVAKSELLAGIEVYTKVLTGVPDDVLLLYIEQHHKDLVMMCSHGSTGLKRWALGSVAQKVARHSAAPVVVLREHGSVLPLPCKESRPLRLLVALDGSPVAETVLAPAARLCRTLAAPGEGTLHLLRIMSPLPMSDSQNEQLLAEAKSYMSRLTKCLQAEDAPGLTIETSVVVSSDIAHTIISAAEHGEFIGTMNAAAQACDMIAMATHGRSGISRLFIGSITDRVLGATKLPLLIVRPPKMMQKEEG
jgi:nucleotide-binding universal stress UspA family protein